MHFNEFQYTTARLDKRSLYVNVTPTQKVEGKAWLGLVDKVFRDNNGFKNLFYRFNLENVESENDPDTLMKMLEKADKEKIENTYCAFIRNAPEREDALQFFEAIADSYESNLILKTFPCPQEADEWLNNNYKALN